jgi:hypothetical protein
MSEGTETIDYQRFITTGGGRRDVQQPYILPWPAMEGLMDDANKVDYEQYPPPKELFLLLDEAETPPEIREIVLRSTSQKRPPLDFRNSRLQKMILQIPRWSKPPKAVDLPQS